MCRFKARSARPRSVLRSCSSQRALLDCDPLHAVTNVYCGRPLIDASPVALESRHLTQDHHRLDAGANMPVTGAALGAFFRCDPCLPMCEAGVRRHVIRASLRWRSSDARRNRRIAMTNAARRQESGQPVRDVRSGPLFCALVRQLDFAGTRKPVKTRADVKCDPASFWCRRKPGEPSRDLRCDPGLFSKAFRLPPPHPGHKKSLADMTRESSAPGCVAGEPRKPPLAAKIVPLLTATSPPSP